MCGQRGAPAALLLLGGLWLTVPAQMRDMLAFADADHPWAGVSFQLALVRTWRLGLVLVTRRGWRHGFGIDDWQRSSRAYQEFNWRVFTWLPRFLLPARFGIDDWQRSSRAYQEFNWRVFTWLPRFLLLGSFLLGAAIAFLSQRRLIGAWAIGLGVLAIGFTIFSLSESGGHAATGAPATGLMRGSEREPGQG